jgi:hypothetical protein
MVQTRDREGRLISCSHQERAETGDQTSADPKQYVRAFKVGLGGELRGGEIFYKA